MLKIVSDLIEGLDRAGVNYVHFKSNEHLWESVIGKTDFDILVDRPSVAAFERVLLELNCKRFHSQPGSVYPGVDDWLGMDEETGALIHLHTHYQLVTGKSGFKNYVLPWAALALETRQKDADTGMYIASPEFELIELYTRIPAKLSIRKDWKARRKGYTVSGENLREAKWLWERIDPKRLEEMAGRCFPGRTIDCGVFTRERFSPQEYRTFRRFVLDVLELHQRGGMELVNLRSNVYKLRIKIQNKLKKNGFHPEIQQKKVHHTGGLLIAFLGVDGSGKTTVTQEIGKWLSWKMEVSHMSLGVGRFKQSRSYRMKQKIKKLLGKKPAVDGAAKLPSEAPIKRTLKNRRKEQIKVRFARELRRDLRRIAGYCRNGGIMVVDRYPQLQFFGISDGPKVNCAYPELQKKELEALGVVREIQPDLVFKLMVPVEVSMSRRPEDAEEVLRRKYEILQAVEYPDAVTIAVDATQPLDQELLFIKKKIWEFL